MRSRSCRQRKRRSIDAEQLGGRDRFECARSLNIGLRWGMCGAFGRAWPGGNTRPRVIFGAPPRRLAFPCSPVGHLPQSERNITSSSEPSRKPADGRRADRSPYARERINDEPILNPRLRSFRADERRFGRKGKQPTTDTSLVAWARSKDVPRQRRGGCCVESRNRRCLDHACRTRTPRRTTRVLRSDADRPRSKP